MHGNPGCRPSPRTALFQALDTNRDGLLQHAELLASPELTEKLVSAICNPSSVSGMPAFSEPITPRSAFSHRTTASAALQLLPKRLHRTQPVYTGLAAEVLAAVRRELLPVLTSALSQAAAAQNEMNEDLQLILVTADDGTAQLLDQLVPPAIWQEHPGMWETTLGAPLMKQVTTGQLPGAHMVMVLSIWGTEPTEEFRAAQAMVAAHTAMYPDHKCTVLVLHASRELPQWLVRSTYLQLDLYLQPAHHYITICSHQCCHACHLASQYLTLLLKC